MTQAELKTHLKSLGFPVAYSHFETSENTPPPKPPYITYMFSSSDDFIADNINYHSISNFTVELYTSLKEPITEELLENKLKELQFPYTKMESWVESDKLFQIAYEIQI